MPRGGCYEEITVRAIVSRITRSFFEAREEVYRVKRHLYVDGRGKLRAHASHALARGALALVRLALKHKHIAAACLRQMIGNARAHYAAAYDDHVRSFSHRAMIIAQPFSGVNKRQQKKSPARAIESMLSRP